MSDTAVHLIYDENCPLCIRFLDEVKRRDRVGRIEPVGFEDPRIRQLTPGMTEEQLRRSFHLVFPDGRVVSGSRAVPALLKLLPGGKVPGWLLEHLPGSAWLSEKLYAWIATHRQ